MEKVKTLTIIVVIISINCFEYFYHDGSTATNMMAIIFPSQSISTKENKRRVYTIDCEECWNVTLHLSAPFSAQNYEDVRGTEGTLNVPCTPSSYS